MFSNLDNTIYRWIFVIPPHIYVTRILLPLQSYFKYYVIWDGKQHIREVVSSSGWKDIEIEEDFFGDYTHDEEKYHQLSYFRGDVREFDFQNCSLVTSIFTLQFMSPKDRQDVLNRVYKGLNLSLIHISEPTRPY